MTSEYKRDLVHSASQHFDNVIAIILSEASKGSGLLFDSGEKVVVLETSTAFLSSRAGRLQITTTYETL